MNTPNLMHRTCFEAFYVRRDRWLFERYLSKIVTTILVFVVFVSHADAARTLDETIAYIRDVIESECAPQTLRFVSHKHSVMNFTFTFPGISGEAPLALHLDEIESTEIVKVNQVWAVRFTGSN